MLVSSLVLSLALCLSPDALAADSKIKNIRIRQTTDTSSQMAAVTSDADGEIASVTAELDGEELTLEESDAWLHGTATLGALPAEGAQVTLTVYDRESAPLATFSGGYVEGALTLSAPRDGEGGDDGTCRACEEGESSTTAVDLELLAATVFADGTVGLDLAGADALSVASATLSVVESSPTEECVTWSRTGDCVEWGASLTRTDAEVDLDELGVVWESGAVALDGATEGKVKAWDAEGEKLDKAKVRIAPAWEDEGDGVNVLVVDEDPLTSVAVEKLYWAAGYGSSAEDAMVVISEGWTLGDALPELAEVELEGGETWEIPVNSYQLAQAVALDAEVETIEEVLLDGEVLELREVSAKNKKYYVNSDGSRMVVLGTDEDGAAWASVTAWAADPDELPAGLTFSYGIPTDVGIDGEDYVSFDDEVAVVFAIGVDLDSDPHGLDLVGKVKLQGAANSRGKRSTLAKGSFAGQLGTDGDGDLDLAAIDKTGDTVSRGDILIGGEPIDIEKVDGEGGSTNLPPAVVYKDANPSLKVKAFRRLQLGSD